MLDTSRKWIYLVVTFAMVKICFAQVPPAPANCTINPMSNMTSIKQMSARCCNDSSGVCASQYNGHCKFIQLAGSCDYTMDVCNSTSANCTCCGSCKEISSNSTCKQKGGRCSTNCRSDEYNAGWFPCPSKCCKCCMMKCNQSTCANGTGYCTPTGICRRGYYPSQTQSCTGFACTCCVPCGTSSNCTMSAGFCQYTGYACPLGYQSSTSLCCPNSNCRCCHRGVAPVGPVTCPVPPPSGKDGY